MKSILPSAISLTATTLKDGRIRFAYVETFAGVKAPEGQTMNQVLGRTIELFRSAVVTMPGLEGLRIVKVKGGVKLSGVVDREQFGNMMIGEFMCWGTMGETKLRDLLISATLARVTPAAA